MEALREAKKLVPQELAKQMATSMFGGSARGGATFVRTAADQQADNIPAPSVEDKTVEELEAANKAASKEGTEELA